MEEEKSICQELKKVGASLDIIEKFSHYEVINDKDGEKRVLCRLRRLCNDELRTQKNQLSCLDYIITKVEEENEKWGKHTVDIEKTSMDNKIVSNKLFGNGG